ncbi:MAG: YdcF family protein [Pseudomonadota bacterium]
MQQQEETQSSGRLRRFLRVALAICFAVAAALLVGFVLFVAQVKDYQVPDPSLQADGIVVLTGGVARLSTAAELLRDGRGKKLLISGVNENTSAQTIKKLLLLDDALFSCCVDLDREALDTIGNAQAAINWAQRSGFESLLWVTNDYHMARSLLEVDRIGGDEMEITPYPVSNPTSPSAGWSPVLDRYRVLVGEYAKYLVALMRTPQVMRGINALYRTW